MWVLFELPTSLHPHGADLRRLRPTGDFLVLLTAYGFLRASRHERVLRRVFLVAVGVLVFVRIDWTICWLVTRSRPLFYDQLFLIRHFFVLVSDLWSAAVVPWLVGGVLGVWGIVVLARALSREGRGAFAPERRREAAFILAAAWVAILALTALGKPAGSSEPRARWIFPELVANLLDSYRIYRVVRRGIVDSPYEGYAAIPLTRRPNVTFFFVESYGRIVADTPELAARIAPRLEDMQKALTADGWSMVSGFSTAPVSGGRSWLAVGSIFMGTNVAYESVFRHLVGAVGRLPTVPSFFAAHGYDTIGLEPSDRARPGVEETNYYRLEHTVRLNDLHYTGKAVGWGLIPDQYSLGFVEDSVLARSGRPRFFMFHMVSSHLPWSMIPPLADDWHLLNGAWGAPMRDPYAENQTLFQRANALSQRLRRYGRDEVRSWVTHPALGDDFRERYVDTVAYDLTLIERHLLREHADELVIVMGDHQPPVVAPDGENFDVPVYVFARDPSLLAEFRDRGFTPGLLIDPRAEPVVEHAGLFSVLVRDLVRVQPGAPSPPPYLRRGMELTAAP